MCIVDCIFLLLSTIPTPPHATDTSTAPIKTYMIATRFEENIFITITICLNALGHKPDKLIEADVPVAIDVDHIDQVLQLLLGRRPPKRPHHLRFFQSLKRSTCTVTTCPSSSEPIEPPPSLRKSIFCSGQFANGNSFEKHKSLTEKVMCMYSYQTS